MSPFRPHFAYVFERFPSFTQTFCVREVRELQRRGARLALFSIRDTREETVRHFPPDLVEQVTFLPPAKQLAEEVQRLKEQNLLPPHFVVTLRHWGKRPDKQRLYEAAWIGYKLRAARVTHVHTHFAGVGARACWWLRRFFGVSYSFTGHANDLFCPDEATDLKLPRLVEDAACVVAVSDFTAGWLRRNFPEAASRVRRVYNGLDTRTLAGTAALHAKSDPPLIVSVGRLIEKKGFDDLIRACAALRERGLDFRCVIAGDGPLRDNLRALVTVSGLEDRVTLAGPKSQEEITELLGRARVFALPCVTETDGGKDVLPTVIMEAMAAGLPCVSTRVAGVPEMIVENKTGFLTDERRPEAFANALEPLLRDAALAAEMGAAGQALARERFDQSVTGEHLLRELTAFCGFPGAFRLPGMKGPALRFHLFRRFTRAVRPPRHRRDRPVFP